MFPRCRIEVDEQLAEVPNIIKIGNAIVRPSHVEEHLPLCCSARQAAHVASEPRTGLAALAYEVAIAHAR